MESLGAERRYTKEYRAVQQQIEKLIADTGPIYGTERTLSALMDLIARKWNEGRLIGYNEIGGDTPNPYERQPT